jgi:hypothetical protein
MAIGLKVGPIFYKIGTGSFLNCFFSSITYHLENAKRGSKFPCMKQLYQGELLCRDIPSAEIELKTIRSKLKSFSPDKVIWDIDDLSKKSPWNGNIADRITSLSNYFYTSDGVDLFDVFLKAFDAGKQIKKDVILKSL